MRKFLDLIDIPFSKDVYMPSDDSILFVDYLDGGDFSDTVEKTLFNKELPENIRILDLGCGTGILGYCFIVKYLEIILRIFKTKLLTDSISSPTSLSEVNKVIITVVFTDINPKAVKIARLLYNNNINFINGFINQINALLKNQPVFTLNAEFVISDLFTDISPTDYHFDYIIFNPPYLPSEKESIDGRNFKPIDYSWDSGDESGTYTLLRFLRCLFGNSAGNNPDGWKYLNPSGFVIWFITSSFADNRKIFSFLKEKNLNITLCGKIHICFEDIMLFKITP